MTNQPREPITLQLRQRLEALARSGLDRIPVRLPDPSRRPVARPRPTAERRSSGSPPASEPTPPSRPAPALPGGSLFGDEGFPDPPVPVSERARALSVVQAQVATCVRCGELAAKRTQTVFGVGDPVARLMFIGEAPGADEDRLGFPFVGRAGQLLTDMITKGMGLNRQDVYIANILKCRPPENRDPVPEEVANCIGYLERQIAIIRPEFLCLLGRVASQRMLDTALPMGKLRGKWHRYRGIPALVTYHPAALLRNPAWKREAWEDLQMLMRAMGLKLPERRKE